MKRVTLDRLWPEHLIGDEPVRRHVMDLQRQELLEYCRTYGLTITRHRVRFERKAFGIRVRREVWAY